MDALKERLGTVVGIVIGIVICVAWAWPVDHWENEWYQGDCLAWNVTEYAGGWVEQVDGPFIVADRWC